jgi:hypothetical protein
MGLIPYLHIDRVLDHVLTDEPQARERIGSSCARS